MNRPVPAVVDAVAAAAAAVDGTDPLDEATHRRLGHDGLAGTAIWTDADRGFAIRHDGALDLVVTPDSRGGGIGARLAADAVAEPGSLTAWSHGDHPAARALASRHGFERLRELWVMRRPAAEPLPALPAPPGLSDQPPPELPDQPLPGKIVVRSYREGDRAELLRVNAEAFAHHPEQGSMDEADLADRMAQDWFDPAGLLVADTGETPTRLAGFHWTKRHSEQLGEVYVVGIDPTAQGQGLGRVLTLAGLHHLRDAGVREILLYVESDNAPAVRVYSRLGFTHADQDTHVQYLRR